MTIDLRPSAVRRSVSICALGAVGLCIGLGAQVPTFRAGVDLVAVDVQVVDRNGEPIVNLDPARFSVSIDGHKRRVVSVDQIRHSTLNEPSPRMPAIVAGPTARNDWPSDGPVGRTFLIAFNLGSFSIAESRRAAEAARAFLDRLPPNDVAGLYSYPFGPRIAPTSDRNALRAALGTVTGGAQTMLSQFHLTAGEVIDISSEIAGIGLAPNFGRAAQRGSSLDQAVAGAPTNTLRRVLLRECGSENDSQCAQNIEREVNMLAFFYENQVTREINDLGGMIRQMGTLPGRKTVVLLSAGMPAGDRPGSRPSTSELARTLGEEAARSNATIYSLFFDSTSFLTYAPETRAVDRHPVFQARESEVLGRFLDQFSSTSGGAMMRVVVGAGEVALAQILRETSAYYLIGVQPDKSDRDGKTHRLRVRVESKGSTIRSRTFVHIPAAASSAGR